MISIFFPKTLNSEISFSIIFCSIYSFLTKFKAIRGVENFISALNIEFEEVYKRTNTSYKPTAEGLSDYKSAS